MSNGELRRQAEGLLFLALHARERGNLELADELTARAMRLFDETSGLTNISRRRNRLRQLFPTPTTTATNNKRCSPVEEDGEEK